QRLAVLEEAGRHGPVAAARLDGAPAEQDAPRMLGHAAHHHARILVMHHAAGRTHPSLARVARRHRERGSLATIAAETLVHHILTAADCDQGHVRRTGRNGSWGLDAYIPLPDGPQG